MERRKDWNTKTPDAFALPTEIWRETVERLQRCEDVLAKIRKGEITHINDFITYNLDIRSFVYDLLHNTDDRLFVLHFYKALQRVTILDPTCGSGAFLFAAMNILEPLYEVCIERMQELNAQNPNWFKPELEEIAHKYRSNIQYFIYKSIILRNLYGVDIMVEATEIAKLRLFLKMMAVVEVDFRADNMGLDPLPDIDFNIRCGNTLVGYATEEELAKDLDNPSDFNQMWANDEFKDKLKTEMQLVATAYETFKAVQFTQSEDMATFKQAKHGLNERLAKLNELLNRRLHAATTSIPYEDWLITHQPFHWLAEFYQIIHDNKGFDVIIGNPPYVEYNKKDRKTGKAISDLYKIKGYKTESCGNLYAYIIERCYSISHSSSMNGYIIPSASICTPRKRILYDLLAQKGYLWTSIWDERPSKLFDGVDQQLCIQITRISTNIFSFITKMNHWSTDLRTYIFQNIDYIQYSSLDFIAGVPPKIQGKLEANILHKIFRNSSKLCEFIDSIDSNSLIYYRNAGGRYWRLVKSFPTYFKSSTSNITTTEKTFKVTDKSKKMIVTILSSSLFYWFWRVSSNCRHLTNREIESFPFSDNIESNLMRLNSLCDIYEESLERN